MSIHRYAVVVGAIGMVFGLGLTPVRAQAPPVLESEAPPIPRAEDAAARALRSLYVPDGLTSNRAVREIIATSPELKRTKALLKEAKGGAL